MKDSDIPRLAFGVPFHLGMTIYIMLAHELRKIETSPETHEIERIILKEERIDDWSIGSKGTGCGTSLTRYADSPYAATRYMTEQSFRNLAYAQKICNEEVDKYTELLDLYYENEEQKTTKGDYYERNNS